MHSVECRACVHKTQKAKRCGARQRESKWKGKRNTKQMKEKKLYQINRPWHHFYVESEMKICNFGVLSITFVRSGWCEWAVGTHTHALARLLARSPHTFITCFYYNNFIDGSVRCCVGVSRQLRRLFASHIVVVLSYTTHTRAPHANDRKANGTNEAITPHWPALCLCVCRFQTENLVYLHMPSAVAAGVSAS